MAVAEVERGRPVTASYLLCPGLVRSRNDGDWHHVSAMELAWLYGVRMAECLVLPDVGRERFPCERLRLIERCEAGGDLVMLRPCADGQYQLPSPPTP